MTWPPPCRRSRRPCRASRAPPLPSSPDSSAWATITRMSSAVCVSTPAGAGSIPKSRVIASADFWSTQTTGYATRPSQSSGMASTSATVSAFCSEIAFGTSSPTTTDRYVRTRNAIAKASQPGMPSKRSETSGPPMAPSMIPKIVMPTWTVLMNRTGSSISLRAVWAGRLPPSARGSRRLRRAVTSAYSAATKIAFPSTSRRTAMTRKNSLTPGAPGDRYSTEVRRPRCPRSIGKRRGWSMARTPARIL